MEQTLAAVWSDLFELFPETALEDDAEEIAWGFVNLFHRAAAKRSAQIDRATDEIRCLIASNDGSEVHASELEEQVDRARAAEAAMIGLESLREAAATLYLNETGASWRPAGSSRLCHSSKLTSAVVDGREFLRVRADRRRKAILPEGTPVVFAGGRLSFPTEMEAKMFASNLWATLDRVRVWEGVTVMRDEGRKPCLWWAIGNPHIECEPVVQKRSTPPKQPRSVDRLSL